MLRDIVSDTRAKLRAAGFVAQAGLVRQLGSEHIRVHTPVLMATLREALLKGTRCAPPTPETASFRQRPAPKPPPRNLSLETSRSHRLEAARRQAADARAFLIWQLALLLRGGIALFGGDRGGAV